MKSPSIYLYFLWRQPPHPLKVIRSLSVYIKPLYPLLSYAPVAFSFADNDFIDRMGYTNFLSAGSAANEDGRKNAASTTMVHLLCK